MAPVEVGTIHAALTSAEARLQRAGVETPRLDAQLLLAHVIGKNRTYVFAHPHKELPRDQRRHFDQLLARREKREPLPYLLGEWEFMGMCLRVSPAVLIPRPETETLVEAAARSVSVSGQWSVSTPLILDVGTGSGCVSLGLTRLLPGAEIVALEPSPEAAAVARENVARHRMAQRVRVLEIPFPECSSTAARAPQHPNTATPQHPVRPPSAFRLPPSSFDAVVSNPPYIPSAEVDRLAPELRCYEPRMALDGGTDGLDLIRSLVSHSPSLLGPGGLLALEVALGQAEQVTELLRSNGSWDEPEVVPDLAGIPRVVIARKARV